MSARSTTYISLTILGCILVPAMTQAVSLSVPFTSQAPYGNWREPWHNACEETSIVMVDAFYRGNIELARAEAKQDILDIFAIKNKYIGHSFDETAETMASLINRFLPWEAAILEDPTVADIEQELDLGYPIIIPVYAQTLQNPHFRGTFPYHVLVISGYDSKAREFITQEPGTRHGDDYRYAYSTIMEAIHDFDPVDTSRAPRRIIVTRPTLTDSAHTDADQDELSKEDELRYGTSLTNPDTDSDGYTDGVEIRTGHSPLDNEKKILKNGALLKASDSPAVFLYSKGTISAFANEKAFLRRGYRWSDIVAITPLLRDLQTRGSVLY